MRSEPEELRLLLRSRFPIIVVETAEERRFLPLLENVSYLDDQPLFSWTLVQGLKRHPKGEGIVQTRELQDALWHLVKTPQNGIFAFFDPHPFLDDPGITRLIREIAFDHTRTQQTLVLVGSRMQLDADLQRMSAGFRLAPIGVDEVRKLFREEAELYAYQHDQVPVKGDRTAYEMLVQHLVGLSRDDARRMIRQSIEDGGGISMDDVARVLRMKHESLGGGTLRMVTEIETLERVGGQKRIKQWLQLRRDAFLRAEGTGKLDVPKGMLLLGVQGAGKSLAARAVAGSWGVPLLRLDFGALYNKFHGETERNLRNALDTAGQMQPCVLWLDEIEKGVAAGSGDGDGGVSRRVLASLLTWMSERRERVFLIATANDIESLPPELLRKGRFDEIFFVDLPDAAVRAEIFGIHLARRGHAVEAFDLAALSAAAERFSGAEIEQAIVAAAYAAHAAKVPLATAHILNEVRSTRPLAVVRAEEVAALREWAAGRTVTAD